MDWHKRYTCAAFTSIELHGIDSSSPSLSIIRLDMRAQTTDAIEPFGGSS